MSRPTALEVLFNQASQGKAFLLMVLCGVLLGLCVRTAGLLHRREHLAGLAADALCAALLTAALGQTVLWTGGLRLYALLGLCIGGLLYLGCAAPLTRLGEKHRAQRESPKPPTDKKRAPSP